MKKVFFSLLPLIFSTFAFADCPAPEKIYYVCAGNQFSHSCNWQASGYEGFTLNHADLHGVTTVDKFVKVFWGRSNGQTTGPGSTLCYYETSNGVFVMMGQNDFGNVAEPTGFNWPMAVDDELNYINVGKVCTHDCHFAYGS